MKTWRIEIYGFTVEPQFTQARSAKEAVTSVIAREYQAGNKEFKNKYYSVLSHLITAIIGPSHRHTWGNVSFSVEKAA
jgi:hypothetical protein